jgi:cytochrome bd-type quinol oxidase subunit 2
MTTSKSIAGLIGPTFVAGAVAVLVNLRAWPALVEQGFHDPALIFASGFLLFVAGLAIVRAHNRWEGGWPVLVTVLGWLSLLGGLLRMLFPTRLAPIAIGAVRSTGVVPGVAIVLLVVGAFLSFKGYSRESR